MEKLIIDFNNVSKIVYLAKDEDGAIPNISDDYCMETHTKTLYEDTQCFSVEYILHPDKKDGTEFCRYCGDSIILKPYTTDTVPAIWTFAVDCGVPKFIEAVSGDDDSCAILNVNGDTREQVQTAMIEHNNSLYKHIRATTKFHSCPYCLANSYNDARLTHAEELDYLQSFLHDGFIAILYMEDKRLTGNDNEIQFSRVTIDLHDEIIRVMAID